MRIAPVVALALVLALGCRSEDEVATAKFDAPLRQKAERLQQSKQSETLSLFGKCRSDVDDVMKRAIEKTGATVTSSNADLFTARVPSERLMKLARLDFVTQLQLAQVSQPTSP